jgi:hypothetical protein
MPPPDGLDRLPEPKRWVAAGGSRIVELQRLVAALRDEICGTNARRWPTRASALAAHVINRLATSRLALRRSKRPERRTSTRCGLH